jgi:hypothetical protein
MAIFPDPLVPTIADITVVLVASTFDNTHLNWPRSAMRLTIQGDSKADMVGDFAEKIRALFGTHAEIRVLKDLAVTELE